jgi:ribonuclease VapC
MIALDTSAILAIALDEPEAEPFQSIVARDPIAVGWPTLLESRMALAGKGFSNASAIVGQLARLPNVTTVAFGEAHYRAAEDAFDRFGRGRHPAALNMGDCFSYAVAAVIKAPLLFKGQDFGRTDISRHPASALL